MAEAAKAALNRETVDTGRVAGAAADLLEAAFITASWRRRASENTSRRPRIIFASTTLPIPPPPPPPPPPETPPPPPRFIHHRIHIQTHIHIQVVMRMKMANLEVVVGMGSTSRWLKDS
ncbi:hypothetical protein LOK49_Contig35G00008 [Camellia lanceoleosa]|nr:hypothetical protein LOK49_Contig35G00008 [Camellia lanceoleosa]